MKSRERRRIAVVGAVQGVGFRPYVYRLATACGLGGWVRNTRAGVEIEVEGDAVAVGEFCARFGVEVPEVCEIRRMEIEECAAVGEAGFEIRESGDSGGEDLGEMVPDIATCGACLGEIFEPGNRRFHYPFTNCSHCGPRYSIVTALPYDRKNTTMRGFVMCAACRREYEDPGDRRFHAQPNACPACGPRVMFRGLTGREAMDAAADAVRNGEILAVRGVGGFHLVADARDAGVVRRLRDRKRRPDKPLAVMFPAMEEVLAECEISDVERGLLVSAAAPVVLMRRRKEGRLPVDLAPGSPLLGALLPYAPLHHILLRSLGFPVVATSGNLAGEPMCIGNEEVEVLLAGVADGFLTHDRPIARAVDDSVACEMGGREMVLRRSRGMAPRPIEVAYPLAPAVALGGDDKNTIAVGRGSRVFLSQHHGDLATPGANAAFVEHVRDFPQLCGARAGAVTVHDLHPGYFGKRSAPSGGGEEIGVQHHHAHLASCLADNGVDGDVLGVIWDGTGYGSDGKIWGGEFLTGGIGGYSRFDHLREFPLPGGERAVREPRYAALGLLFEAGIEVSETPLAGVFSKREMRVAVGMLERGHHAPLTSSAGRLFDAVAALLGIRQRTSFEGQAAMELEYLACGERAEGRYESGEVSTDWEPLVRAVLEDVRVGVAPGLTAVKFHHALVDMILGVARRAGRGRVALSGGCFQNRYLTERVIKALGAEGFEPLWHRRVPPNDGGLSLGQAVVAGRLRMRENGAK